MARRRELIDQAIRSYGLRVGQACQLFAISRRVYHYQPKGSDDGPIKQVLSDLAERKPRWGFDKMMKHTRKAGHHWNHKRVYRVYCQLGLNLRKKPKKRLATRTPTPLAVVPKANYRWSMDFMSDVLSGGRRFRTLNILDDFNREALHIDVALCSPHSRVIAVLEQLITIRGKPKFIRVDNGPEFCALGFQHWAKTNGISIDYIEPGKPAQNAYIERFNRTYREDILDAYVFENLEEVRQLTDQWIIEYNQVRPHQALGDMTPYDYLMQAA